MERRAFLAGVAAALAAPRAAGAQQAGREYRIGAIGVSSTLTPAVVRLREAFLAGLHEHGYVEGKNIVLEWRYSEVQGPDDFAARFAAIAQQRPDALLVPSDALMFQYRHQIARLALEARLPTLFEPREMAEAGGLLAYGPSYAAIFRRGAFYVDRLLRGVKPADLPFEQPNQFELVLNLKTAKALGLTVPQSLLLRADQVIE